MFNEEEHSIGKASDGSNKETKCDEDTMTAIANKCWWNIKVLVITIMDL